ARGCLDPDEQRLFKQSGDLPHMTIMQTSGSSGAPPLRIPRTSAEIQWLGTKLFQHHVERYGELPERCAFLGGISHMEANRKFDVQSPVAVRNFRADQLAELDAFDPNWLSMYPSFCREIVANESLELKSLQFVKLGGETIFPSDLEKIWKRFPEVDVVEQFGSTEMPALAFRSYTRAGDSGYRLSTDRYSFRFEDTEGWQTLVVRDNFPERAFPIEGWFETDDEVLVRGGQVIDVRRKEDPVFPIRAEIDALLAAGCINVQILADSGKLIYDAPPEVSLPATVTIGGRTLRSIRGRPYRLIDSNKLPLVVDTTKVSKESLYEANRPV
ncbi:MAG: hypothetical protein D6815_05030, partial [Candidatus Dadabacteria bacterium]